MKTEAGKSYFGFICKNAACGLPIILGEVPAGEVQIQARPEHQIRCERCGYEAVYRLEQVQRFLAREGGQLH